MRGGEKVTKCANCAHNEALDEDLIVSVDVHGFTEVGCELNVHGYPDMERCVHWYAYPVDGD